MAKPETEPNVFQPIDSPLPEWKPGHAITASRLSQHVRRTNALMSVPHAPVQIIRTRERGGSGVKQFRYKSFKTDYISCLEWDGTTLGVEEVNVALPYMLRQTPFDGETRRSITYTYITGQWRTASKSGESDESQVIVMNFHSSDTIYAVSGVAGGTGVTSETGEEVVWQDLNVDGRMWAKLA